MVDNDLINICHHLNFEGDVINIGEFGNGHINDTYLVETTSGNYILQRVNHNIFKDVEMMNNNIIRALGHVKKRQSESGIFRLKIPELIHFSDGKNHFIDSKGDYWRAMDFISGSYSVDVVDSQDIALEAASTFGYFQKMFIDLNPDDFHPTIENFHDLEKRIKAFEKVLDKDNFERNKLAIKEIEFVRKHYSISEKLKSLLESKQIPIRVTHNDTKINNVLFDKITHNGIAVIDLDTIMPGTVLFDFGDMVRTYTSLSAEDEKDLTRVSFRIDVFESLVKGYLSELKSVLTKPEIDNLVFGGKVMIFMIGLRFFTDYLEGDIYYKTLEEHHNLHRCRTQFKLLEEIEEREEELNEIVERLCS